MALGEWLSVTNARELAETQVAREADELEHSPEAEEHELRIIYRAKGLDADEGRASPRRSCGTRIRRWTI
jgi:VIT1/CCC1 family predicted Fe2+/Mn2+ transporter